MKSYEELAQEAAMCNFSELKKYLQDELGTMTTSEERLSGSDRFKNQDVIAAIEGTRKLDGTLFVLGTSRSLALKVLHVMVGDIPPEEELLQDCVGETLNIVLGNALTILSSIEKELGFKTPYKILNMDELQKMYPYKIAIEAESSEGDYTFALFY